jgi:hypothetical protein
MLPDRLAVPRVEGDDGFLFGTGPVHRIQALAIHHHAGRAERHRTAHNTRGPEAGQALAILRAGT